MKILDEIIQKKFNNSIELQAYLDEKGYEIKQKSLSHEQVKNYLLRKIPANTEHINMKT